MGTLRDITSQVHRLWLTSEADAWSRSASYEDYIRIKELRGDTGQPLSKKGLAAFYAMMYSEMEDDICK